MLVLLPVGLVLVVSGASRARRSAGRSDEQRWRGFLVALLGLLLVAAAMVPMHG